MTGKVPDPESAPPHSGTSSHLAQSLPPPAPTDDVPLAQPIEAVPVSGEPLGTAVPMAEPVEEDMSTIPLHEIPRLIREAQAAASASVPLCQSCGARRVDSQKYCSDCGLIFPTVSTAEGMPPPVKEPGQSSGLLLKGRYTLGAVLSRRDQLVRYRAMDAGDEHTGPREVVIVQAPIEEPLPIITETVDEIVDGPPDAVLIGDLEEEILPGFDVPLPPASDATNYIGTAAPEWPSLDWEQRLLDRAKNATLPRVLDRFTHHGCDYLVEEVLSGETLWTAWDETETDAKRRYGLLRQVAEALETLYRAGAMTEVLRPEMVVTAGSRAQLFDLSELLPIPLPQNPSLRGTVYTPPELISSPLDVDARAALYSFGALFYALHLGRELTEMDFLRPGAPKEFIPLFPDCHPQFARLMCKTFCRDRRERFPTADAARDDNTGFAELHKTLDVCGRTLDRVRLEIAGWTTTGMLRSGNEDAFTVLHGIEARQDDLGECALILLADGMGGYEAGEVAAALTLQYLRTRLLAQPLFSALVPGGAGGTIVPAPPAPKPFDLEACKRMLRSALQEANRAVFTASRNGIGKRGMGCTAEAVYVDGQHVVVGHVGDSRTYHLSRGQLVQLTRDQTLVNRLVELGQLSPAEAQVHPRRSELQQAVGGQPEVSPEVYHARLQPGDWIVVCSDGVSTHVLPSTMREMLQTATSAEMTARRIVNLVNLEGATDNATVVVVRAL